MGFFRNFLQKKNNVQISVLIVNQSIMSGSAKLYLSFSNSYKMSM